MNFIKGLFGFSQTDEKSVPILEQQPLAGYTDEFEAFFNAFGDDLLSKEEYRLIFNEMDKKDYSIEHPQFDRYMDLKRIKEEIFEKKEKLNEKTEVKEIILETFIDGYPPYNLYTYNFNIPVFRDETFRSFYEQYRNSANRLSIRDFEIIYDAYNEFKDRDFHVPTMIKKISKAKKNRYYRLEKIYVSAVTEIYKYGFTFRFPKKESETFSVFLRNNEPNLKEIGLTTGEIQVIWLTSRKTIEKNSKNNEFHKIKDKIIRLKRMNGNKILKHIMIIGITESIPSYNLYKYVF